MPAWVYQARDSGGRLVKGKADAESQRDVTLRLRNQGFLVLEIDRDRDLQAVMQQRGGLLTRKPSGKDLAIFARQFSTMIGAGLPVVTSLKVLSRQNARLGRELELIAADVEAGETLSAAFSRQGSSFPPEMVQMIAAGEVGGILDEVCSRLALQMEKQEAIRQKVRSAMVYPGIVVGVSVLVLAFLMIFVVPRFAEVFEGFNAQLPLSTRILLGISGWIKRNWWFLPAIPTVAVVGIRYFLRSERGAVLWDEGVLKLPVFGPLVTKQSIAVASRTLGSLLASGITILRALAVAERTVGNRVIAGAIRDALEKVREGHNLAGPLSQARVFPPMVVEMVSVGEETGTLEEMLGKVADFYEDEVQRTAERLSASLEPLVIVFLALTIGVIVLSMVQPIFTLWGSIQ